MVIRPSRNSAFENPAASRRAAQRALAKEIHEGTYQPSNIGARARGETPMQQAIRTINDYKEALRGDSRHWNKDKANQNTLKHTDGTRRTSAELQKIANAIREAERNHGDPADYYDDDGEYDDWESVLYYH
jgi:hypothetical protein